jgi:hypothetical protein
MNDYKEYICINTTSKLIIVGKCYLFKQIENHMIGGIGGYLNISISCEDFIKYFISKEHLNREQIIDNLLK